MTDIRLADELDEPDVLRLCALMHEEQHTYPLSWEKVTPLIRLATRHQRGILGVAGPRGDLYGGIFLLIDEPWFSKEPILIEYFNYVRPEHRRSSLAKDLIGYAKSCAEALKIDLTIGVYSNIRTEAKVRLYRRMVPCAGAFFQYSPPSKRSVAVAAE